MKHEWVFKPKCLWDHFWLACCRWTIKIITKCWWIKCKVEWIICIFGSWWPIISISRRVFICFIKWCWVKWKVKWWLVSPVLYTLLYLFFLRCAHCFCASVFPLAAIAFAVEFRQHLWHNLKNRGCLWLNWDKTCHLLRSPVEFGQRPRRNLKNCGCLWSTWDKTCHYCNHLWNLGSASGVTWRLWVFVVKLGWDLSLIAFACGIWAAPLV